MINKSCIAIIPVILLVNILSSCISWKKMDRLIKDEPMPRTFSSLRICNYAVPDSVEQTTHYYSFYDLNKMSLLRKDTLVNWRETVIQLDSLEKGLMVTFFLRDTLADQYFLKGQWKDNFFYAKRRISAKGIPPLFFFYNEKLSIIGNYDTHVCLFQSELKAGMILLFSAGGHDYFKEQYSIKAP